MMRCLHKPHQVQEMMIECRYDALPEREPLPVFAAGSSGGESKLLL
jgi:hypothetical protein